MAPRHTRSPWIRLSLFGAGTVFAATLTIVAQGPAPTGTQAPAGAPGAAAPQGGQGGQGARGLGGRGRSSELSDFGPRAAYKPRTPAEQAAGFMLPTGYRMELVAADPDVISPTIVEFDGNGRMYVAEMISYMMDAEATREHDPISRISRWESTKGDGHFDKRVIFADKLVAPRMILPLTDGVILTSETDSDDLIKLSDTNGDGVADKKEVVFTGIGQSGDANIEHQKAGLMWNLDNWIYTTYNAFRIRWTPNGFLREPTGANGGQWGLTHDDDGKPWFVDAGGERGPMNFQFPIHYGGFTPCAGAGRGGFGPPPPSADPDCPPAFEPDFQVVWPAPSIGDMQGGMNRIRMPAQNLNHFTATTGPSIVRGDRVPEDLKGDLLFTEPVGRLIRRAKIVKIAGLTQLRNAYPGSEFIISQDQLFRPVNIQTGPDGTQYISDMYHGIIQERQWSGPGSYLRAKIEQFQLDKVAAHGRIWRLRFDGRPAVAATETNQGQTAIPAIPLDPRQPRMYSETPAQLVAHLAHPNGWWRDTAQRLLILKQDKSVVPALQQMARKGRSGSEPAVNGSDPNLPSRFHALWTLEGLGALDAGLVREQMKDPAPRMRVQAIRASETLYKAGDKFLADDYRAMTKDADVDVAIQAMLTLSLFKVPDLAEVVKATQASNTARGVKEIGDRLLAVPATTTFGGGRGGNVSPEQQKLMQQGSEIFTQVCFTCHGDDGRGQPMQGAEPGKMLAPPIAGSTRVQGHRDYVIKVLLSGLSGPVGDRTYPSEVMVPMGSNKDEWIAAISSYVRSSFGNAGGMVTVADVARVRAATKDRSKPWTVAELEATLPRLLEPQPTWKFSASHNVASAAAAVSLRPWNAGAPQAAGMWFQVELPQPVNLAEIQFDSPGAGRGGGGGGRGRGAADAAGRGGAGAPAPGAAAPTAAAPAAPPAAGATAQPAPAAAPGAPPAAGQAAAPPAFGGFTPPAAGYPRGYRVQVSMDGTNWGQSVAEGTGVGSRTVIAFKPVRARYVRITQTASEADSPAWSISNLRLFEVR
jgi:mono/diheme cytochrome c family protein